MKPQATSTQQILQACRQIVRQKGLGSISIREAAAASGVAVGTIYHYFPSKEALLLAVTADVWSQIFGLADDEDGQDGQSASKAQPCPEVAESFVSYVQQMFEGARSRLQEYPGFLGAHAASLGLYGGIGRQGHGCAGMEGGRMEGGRIEGGRASDQASCATADDEGIQHMRSFFGRLREGLSDALAADSRVRTGVFADCRAVGGEAAGSSVTDSSATDSSAADSLAAGSAATTSDLLTSDEFVSFVLQNVLLLLVSGQQSCHALLAVIRATLY